MFVVFHSKEDTAMAPVEDSKKPKRCPNFFNWELFAMISMVSDNKILLLGKLENVNTARRKAMGYWQLPHCANSCPLINNLLKAINKSKW